MSFIPQDYKIPSESRYFKFQSGENDFRVMSSAIVGFEYWTEDKKPVRLREMWKKKPTDIKVEANGSYRTKPFWAFVVWNYEVNAIQIMQITQTTIMRAIKALVDNKKWGDPKDYDLTITRTGEGLKTEYSIVPSPKNEVQAEIAEEFKNKPVNLEALFLGEDPFDESIQPKTSEQIQEEKEINEAVSKL